MKIGLLTYHRSNNYGALLQAIALRHVLEEMGHQATFIDYWPAYHRHMYAAFSFQYFMKRRRGLRFRISYLRTCLLNYNVRLKRIANFGQFISQNIVPYTSSMDETYDLVVHGSDQIWRKQPEMNAYNPFYFGKHDIKASRRISYAASMGILPKEEADKQKIERLLHHLDDISVREGELLNLVKSLGFLNARQDLDPTLLMTSCNWVDMFKLQKREPERRYALYYKIKDSFDVNMLRQYASSKGLTLKIIYNRAVGKDTDSQITTAEPSLFLDLFYNAAFIFTSSFHGLAFSLIFQKPFLASFTDNAGRAASLLAALDLPDRLVSPKTEIPSQIAEIDYNNVASKLNQMRASSMEFLDGVISSLE